jgi:hypothetical protein
MRNIADQIVEDIANDARNTLNRVTRHIAKRVADDWMIVATHVMDDYYGDYSETTMRYKRTYSLFNDAIVPVFWKKNDMYTVGVKFNPFNMKHRPLPMFNEEDIFGNFMEGKHGNEAYAGSPNARDIAITSPGPKSVLDAYYNNYDKQLNKYFNEAVRLHVK